jgi:DNA processing protein
MRMPALEVWTVRRGDEGYPPQLADLDERPEGLEPAPGVVYGRGQVEALAPLRRGDAVTIVGSRRASGYGIAVARRLAAELAQAGVAIVSGLAYGIDSAAHAGALEADGVTVAVLAGGPDVVYPRSAASLYRRILVRGAAISERVPGTVPERWSFPTRNRIMAALAPITVVVEAADASGSAITARNALALGRTVGAVPGPVTSRVSAGTTALLRDGAAPIAGAEDVLDLLYGVGARVAARRGPALDPELEPVLAAVEGGAQTADAVALASGLGGREVAVALTRLELVGYVQSTASGLYERTTLRVP